MANSKTAVEAVKVNNGVKQFESDEIAVEQVLNIYINKELYASLMCTPVEKVELAIGFLFAEGVIASMDDVLSIVELHESIVCAALNYEPEDSSRKRKALTSGCAKGNVDLDILEGQGISPVKDSCDYQAGFILNMMREFNHKSELFKETGGVHSCAICNSGGIVLFSEDIGRHNALDKVIGKALRNNMELKDKLLMTTGRISSDIAVKAARAGIPIIVSHSAPTDMAIEIAKRANITIAGFARGSRMNIYCGSHRIKL
ncbi:MAG: fdhD [Clostridia bacterium]|jgi:FdhD protein|nr:fdhD [Clostridia bacterium]